MIQRQVVGEIWVGHDYQKLGEDAASMEHVAVVVEVEVPGVAELGQSVPVIGMVLPLHVALMIAGSPCYCHAEEL